ncbi:uncharacterized protein EI90DRAFT_2915957, partial [Cantharellus anzutake]|uniref:uncharacterized protein n=1 Tax=Cantharellus anzutake TaxID=1750568 RepID=UPI00190893A0
LSSMYIGTRISAIAWSPRCRSPAASPTGHWYLELAVGCTDGKIHLITQRASDEPVAHEFSGLPSGHKGNVADLCFFSCGNDPARYLASVGDDRRCILWDLYPSHSQDDQDDEAVSEMLSPSPTPFSPIPYSIAFRHPLRSVASHSSNARCIMVSDVHGTVSMVNWMDLESDSTLRDAVWSGHKVVEFIDPAALSRSVSGLNSVWGGGASWKPSDPDMFGATYGPSWVVWNQRKLQGGKPVAKGEGFLEGGSQFRYVRRNYVGPRS